MNPRVVADEACQEIYQEVKLKGTYKFIIFKINKDNTEIIVDQTSQSTDWEDFVQNLPEDDPRWAVYDFRYEGPEGAGPRTKLAFLSWSPDLARIKSKMLYASSKDALKRRFTGIGADIQASEHSEITYEEVLRKVKQGR